MSPDLLNGAFEAAGGFVILLLNIRGTYRDKMVRGVNPWAVSFFSAWGAWNCWYYPAIDQWFSFAGAVFLAAMNVIWFGQLLYYSRRERSAGVITADRTETKNFSIDFTTNRMEATR